MNLKGMLVAASGSTLLLGAAVLGATGVQAAGNETPLVVPCQATVPATDNLGTLVNTNPNLATCTPATSATTGTVAGQPVQYSYPFSGWPQQPVIVLPQVGTLPYSVSQDSFLNFVSLYLGVNRVSLNAAFEQADLVVAAQPQTTATQEVVLDLVAQYLGVSRASLNAALQQAGDAEVSMLWQSGRLTLAQVSMLDAAIASGQYNLGLGFGVPGSGGIAIP